MGESSFSNTRELYDKKMDIQADSKSDVVKINTLNAEVKNIKSKVENDVKLIEKRAETEKKEMLEGAEIVKEQGLKQAKFDRKETEKSLVLEQSRLELKQQQAIETAKQSKIESEKRIKLELSQLDNDLIQLTQEIESDYKRAIQKANEWTDTLEDRKQKITNRAETEVLEKESEAALLQANIDAVQQQIDTIDDAIAAQKELVKLRHQSSK